MRKSTPWGETQQATELTLGIVSYQTASHGGIWLSKKRQKQLNYTKNFLKNPAWWEEDCDWAVPYIFFANEIEKSGNVSHHIENLTAAWSTVKEYHPDFYARQRKEEIKMPESISPLSDRLNDLYDRLLYMKNKEPDQNYGLDPQEIKDLLESMDAFLPN